MVDGATTIRGVTMKSGARPTRPKCQTAETNIDFD